MISIFILACALLNLVLGQYSPNWTSLDSRPNPSWYDASKFGIFIHWGVYSVPSYGCEETDAGEWYWWHLYNKDTCIMEFHNNTFGTDFQYPDFAPLFRPTLFNPDSWANLFQQSGARYVVLTSKHHDGWCNWKSAQSWNWNSVDNGPHILFIFSLIFHCNS